MWKDPSPYVLDLTLKVLGAEEVDRKLLSLYRQKLDTSIPLRDEKKLAWTEGSDVLLQWSPYGTLSYFLPADRRGAVPRRLGTFDRKGNLIHLFRYSRNGHLCQLKARNLDGRFVGLLRGTDSHPVWGTSDTIVTLSGGVGFEVGQTMALSKTVDYEDVDSLPPLDMPSGLPPGTGGTILNVLAILAKDQGKKKLRYRGPYATERLFSTLRECFTCPGELGANRERFTAGSERAALHADMATPPVDWLPQPYERYHADPDTCVQLRDGLEKVYDRGRIYYRNDISHQAYSLRVEETTERERRYVACIAFLGQPLEDHLVFDSEGGIVERFANITPRFVRGEAMWAPRMKAAVLRLVAAETTELLHATLWPAMEELVIVWGPVVGQLFAKNGNELVIHSEMVAIHVQAQTGAKSAGEKMLLASRFLSEISRILGPLIRERAQTLLSGFSPTEQNVALMFGSPTVPGLSDSELRDFLIRLAQGEELPALESVGVHHCRHQ